ncbi:MAG: nicotinate-nucleotide--dimethylbenzimidazole phosphoribosyltransferase [Clostridiales bacterium]|jgi:nicotinate-nucleotide--dimethylbenzimidazole phosphoribosyltransferase|nr:nicotinate-nucleotide--dimethylbenzimidazole phosphoribosyltransferase [Clostridiales bacterium]
MLKQGTGEPSSPLQFSPPAPPDESMRLRARARLDSLVKPPGSLGGLEDIAAQLAAITGELFYEPDKRLLIIMAADNGVVAEGVSSAPKEVTASQTLNFTRGVTGAAVLARQFGAELMVVDVGIDADIENPGIINKKIRKSTGNIAKEPAMTLSEAAAAVNVGIWSAGEAKRRGFKVIGAGEMGIGNTTTSSAVLCALLGLDAGATEQAVGRGAGLTDGQYARKISVISSALALHRPKQEDPLDVISKVGGLDIAAMCGVYIGAALNRLPVVADGFISAVAALCAVRLCPDARGYIFPSHESYERGYALAARELEFDAPLKLGMRLGEGSGCPLMFALMDAAAAVIKNMATFKEAMIDERYLENINGKKIF